MRLYSPKSDLQRASHMRIDWYGLFTLPTQTRQDITVLSCPRQQCEQASRHGALITCQ